MEMIKMKSEKKTLIKNFKLLIEDLLDNYDQYTDEEKAQIKELLQNVADLNTILDKYDVEKTFDLMEYLSAYSLYFATMR